MANGDPLEVGISNNKASSATLLITNGSAFGDPRHAFWVQRVGAPGCGAAIRGDNFSTGASSTRTNAGVLGMADASAVGVGVLGCSGPSELFWGETGVLGVTNSFGVVGKSLFGPVVDEQGIFVSGTGVVGECNDGVGVHGTSTSGWGIIGQSFSRTGVTGKSVSGVGVEARSDQSHALRAAAETGVGVLAESLKNNGVLGTSRDAAGVEGFSEQGFAGVHGRSVRGSGVLGTSEQGVGVLGGSSTGIGIGGYSLGGGWAGYFEGDVIVQGAFYVTGGPKAAAVKHPDGTLRSLFCLESPESYFEDFGEVVLTGATVVVRLEKDFAALVKRNKYQVFLTSYGPAALYVRKRNAKGFEITRVDGGSSGKPRSVRVGYRIVARRADLKAERLPKIKMPAQAAEVTKHDLTTGRANRKRTEALVPFAKLEPLPGMPKIPSPDLKAMVEAKSIDEQGKG